LLVNGRHVKQVPGRKTDVSDAAWLAQLLEAGLASFVPPKPIRTLRNLTRCRKAQIQERQREVNRLHKVLEDTGVELGCVASDILVASGRAMLDALVSGTTNAEVLAELAKGRLFAKRHALREALRGSLRQRARARRRGDPGPHRLPRRGHRPVLRPDRGADRPFRAAVEPLLTIPGVQRRTAEVIVAEVGTECAIGTPAVARVAGGRHAGGSCVRSPRRAVQLAVRGRELTRPDGARRGCRSTAASSTRAAFSARRRASSIKRVELRFDRDEVWIEHRGREVCPYPRSYVQGTWQPAPRLPRAAERRAARFRSPCQRPARRR